METKSIFTPGEIEAAMELVRLNNQSNLSATEDNSSEELEPWAQKCLHCAWNRIVSEDEWECSMGTCIFND